MLRTGCQKFHCCYPSRSDGGVEIEVRMSVRIRKSWLQVYNSVVNPVKKNMLIHAFIHFTNIYELSH